jgi:hypothetical protein
MKAPIFRHKISNDIIIEETEEEEEDYASEEDSESSSDEVIINTKIAQFISKGQENDTQSTASWGKDRIGTELLTLYLESESFPFEADQSLTSAMLRLIRWRRWYWES